MARDEPVTRTPVARTLLSRKTATLAAIVTVLVILGCMSVSIGNRNEGGTVLQDGTLAQEGEVRLQPASTQDVYYPIPYTQLPNLVVTSTFDDCEVIDQKEDHFRVVNHDTSFSKTATWKARGLRIPAPPSVATLPPDPPPPSGPALPPAPVPVSGPNAGR